MAKTAKKVKETKDASEITDTFGGSPVSSNASEETPDTEIDLSKAKVTIPGTAQAAAAPAKEEPIDNSFAARAERASIGLIRVDGIDFRYVGIAPARDKDAKTESGMSINSMNSTFTPLSEVPFDIATRVKIGDTYFFPQNFTSWEGVELDGKKLVED